MLNTEFVYVLVLRFKVSKNITLHTCNGSWINENGLDFERFNWSITMLFYFHPGDIFEQLVIIALVVIGFIAMFSLPFIFLIRDVSRERREKKEGEKE